MWSDRFNVDGQWEECDAGKRTFDLNTRYFGKIHRPLRFEDWDPFANPSFIYANPPCAPWSAANVRMGMNRDIRRVDPRLAMTKRSMETAIALKPGVFALETVARGYSIGKAYYDSWAERWIGEGDGVTYYLTDAILLGVPSTRQRFHFVAHKNDLVLPDEVDTRNFVPKTVSMAIDGLQDKFGHLPHHIPKRMSRAAHDMLS